MPCSLLRALVAALVVVVLAAVTSTEPAVAQSQDPATAVAAAVAALEVKGYVARFSVDAEEPVRGEMRYQSPLAYGLLIEDATGAALEYVFLDPVLYDRRRSAETGAWSGWQRREWHPDLPIEGLIPYHPRLPLELLRAVRGLRSDETGTMPDVLDGSVNYLEALAAGYEDRLSGAFRTTAESALLPVTIHLDPDGGVSRLDMRVPPSASEAPPSIFTVTFLPAEPPVLQAPSEAEEGEPSPFLRPGPTLPVQTLPLTLSGHGDGIESPPFSSDTGVFIARLEPALGGAQYRIWRVKRGRQLLAAVGAIVGGDGLVLPSLALPPGEYVVELELPAAAEWTLTIAEVPAAAGMPVP